MPLALFVTVASTAVIDTSLLTELVNMCKTLMGLFTEFPLNVLLIGSLVGIGFRIFGGAKKAAKK